MNLFVSDMHFGRDAVETERIHESALISCLRHFEKDTERLYLVGDVFDQYIEYPNLIPKGSVRFLGLLAEWVDAGKTVTYLVGNHDPWHIDYFEKELGVRVAFEALSEPLQKKHVYLNHGDKIASRFPLNRLLKRTLQHPVPVFLYRSFLPGDAGFRLARWVNRRIHSDVIDEGVARRLREYAGMLILESGYDLVVMGHSHNPELTPYEQAAYLNTGCWRSQRTFGWLSDDRVTLFEWNDRTDNPTPLKQMSFLRESETSP